MGVGSFAPDVGEARRFGAHDYGGGTGHVGLVVQRGVLKLGGENLYAVVFEPFDGFFRAAADNRDGEDGAHACAYDVGVVDVGGGVADQQGAGSGGVGAAQRGSEISRLFHRFHHHDERRRTVGGAGLKVSEAAFPPLHLRYDAFGAAAVCNFGVDLRRHFEYLAGGRKRPAGYGLERFGREQFRAPENAAGAEPGREAAFHFPAPFDEEKPPLAAYVGTVPERDGFLDFGIPDRCYRLRAHHLAPRSFSGRIWGNRRTSWMVLWPSMSIARRSIPMPIPEVGGMPYSSARTKS